MPVLTNVQHEIFAQAIAYGIEPCAAYEQAGYKKDDTYASRLLKNAKISARIDEIMEGRAPVTNVTVERLVEELANIAFFNIGDVVEWGTDASPPNPSNRQPPGRPGEIGYFCLRNSKELPARLRRGVAKVKQTQNGVEIATYDKLAAIRLLGSHLGMWKDKEDTRGKGAEEILDLIIQAHKRSQSDETNTPD